MSPVGDYWMDFDVQVTVLRVKFLQLNQLDALISQIYFWNKTKRFGQFLCPSSGVFHYTHSNGIRHTGLLTACEQDQDGTDPSWSCSQAVSKHIWCIPLLCVQWKTPDNGQRNYPKHDEFFSKIKFEKLVHLVDFIVGILNGFYSMTLLGVGLGVIKIIFGSLWDHYNPL